MLKRKIDDILIQWKNKKNHKPLIISGVRQCGKTTAVENFAKCYKSFVEINFVTMPKYKKIFENGYEVDNIIKEISLLNPEFKFIDNDTLILFDEIQEYPDAVTSLKPFSLDQRFDVICSGSLLGVNYKKINSIPVGFKEEIIMHSLDFEEFLWAKGYSALQINDIYEVMKKLNPLSGAQYDALSLMYRDYLFVGGMPEAIQNYVSNKTFSDVFAINSRIYKDYEDDITKYVEGLDYAKVLNVFHHISSQLAKDNHKFQISKIGHGSRSREYTGTDEWLKEAGIINIAYNLNPLELPLNVNEVLDNTRIYFADHSLFVSSLDEETKEDMIVNKNYNIYNGSVFESLVSEELIKSGYDLYFYKNEDATTELDFIIRVKNEIIPIEVKRTRGKSKSLDKVIMDMNYDIHYGVKLSANNIGFENNIFTFPYFLTFLLKRFFKETEYIKW